MLTRDRCSIGGAYVVPVPAMCSAMRQCHVPCLPLAVALPASRCSFPRSYTSASAAAFARLAGRGHRSRVHPTLATCVAFGLCPHPAKHCRRLGGQDECAAPARARTPAQREDLLRTENVRTPAAEAEPCPVVGRPAVVHCPPTDRWGHACTNPVKCRPGEPAVAYGVPSGPASHGPGVVRRTY